MLEAEKIAVGWIDPEHVSGHFAHSMATQLRDMEYFGCAGTVHRKSASQPIVARNTIVREFLTIGEGDWLWMVDADMVFDRGHVMKLWEAATENDVKIMSGLAFIWKATENGHLAIPSIFYADGEGGLMNVYNRIEEGPHEVAATGLASVLVHREVFEAMEAPRHPDYRWFDFLPNSELGIVGGEMTGIDVQFFVRARAAGYPMMVEPAAETHHLEELAIGRKEWAKQWTPSS